MNKLETYFLSKSNSDYNDIEESINIKIKSRDFFKTFLNFICDNQSISFQSQSNILQNFRKTLIELSLDYNEILDEFVIATVVSYQKMKTSELLNQIEPFVKFLNFIDLMIRNLNLTNQIISNVLYLLNKLIDFLISKGDNFTITTETISIVSFLVIINSNITKNVKSFNPRLISFYENIISFLYDSQNKKIIYNKDRFMFYEDKVDKTEYLNEQIAFCIFEFFTSIKNDINIDIIFKSLYNKIDLLLKGEIKYSKAENLYKQFIDLYKTESIKSKNKKNIPMNFLIIKSKPIPCLEPDYDLSFLGDVPEFVNIEEKKANMERVMKRKIRSTEKQAIRKLKKEAKVIDAERQKVLKNIDRKRKEDLRITNQFIEQQNIEYKKMMTTNAKRRFKFKKNKRK